jgi:hypothetical protein
VSLGGQRQQAIKFKKIFITVVEKAGNLILVTSLVNQLNYFSRCGSLCPFVILHPGKQNVVTKRSLVQTEGQFIFYLPLYFDYETG